MDRIDAGAWCAVALPENSPGLALVCQDILAGQELAHG